MRLLNSLSRMIAASAMAGLLLAPVAQADRGRGKDHDRGYHERHYSHDRHYKRDRHHKRDRHYKRDNHWKHSRNYHRGYDRSYKHYYAPKRTVVHRHAPPVYYAPPRTSVRVSYGHSYGPHYYRGYIPRYKVGHYYSYAPRTVYIHEYDRYGLYAPPRGYHWVRDHDRGDAILASVATGAIIGLVVGALAN